MKYKSKPVIIEAFRFRVDPIPYWFMDKVSSNDVITQEKYCLIKTLEGTMMASVGDWIIKGTEGEFYPCKDSVFQIKYEPM